MNRHVWVDCSGGHRRPARTGLVTSRRRPEAQVATARRSSVLVTWENAAQLPLRSDPDQDDLVVTAAASPRLPWVRITDRPVSFLVGTGAERDQTGQSEDEQRTNEHDHG